MVAILYFQLLHLLVEAKGEAAADPMGAAAVVADPFLHHCAPGAAELPGREMLVVR